MTATLERRGIECTAHGISLSRGRVGTPLQNFSRRASWPSTVVKFADTTQSQERNAKQRQREMLGFEKKMRPRVQQQLNAIVAEVVRRTAQRQEPVPSDAQTRWARELYDAEFPVGAAASIAGWNFMKRMFETKEVTDILPDDPFIGIGTPDDFLLSPTNQSVTNYFKLTSNKQAQTARKTVNAAFIKIRDEQSINPETGLPSSVGLNPRKIARKLEQNLKKFTRTYSELIARTGCVWAHNEGSMRQMQSIGVKRKRWYATEDELTCPYCFGLHDEVTGIEQGYQDAEGQLHGVTQGADGELRAVTMNVPQDFSVEHPPAHPNCRCVILADFSEEDLGLLAGDGVPTPAPLPPKVPIPRTPPKLPPASATTPAPPSVTPSSAIPKPPKVRPPAPPASTTPPQAVPAPARSLTPKERIAEALNGDILVNAGPQSRNLKLVADEAERVTGLVKNSKRVSIDYAPINEKNLVAIGDSEHSLGFYQRTNAASPDRSFIGQALKTSNRGYKPVVSENIGKGAFNVSRSVEGTFRHEYAHAYFDQGLSKAVQKKWNLLHKENPASFWRVSTYAKTNANEAFAESFTLMTSPNKKKFLELMRREKLSKKFVDALEKFFEEILV